jgi:hypothetical protein
MVDRKARVKMAEELRHFAAGLTTNDEWERASEPLWWESDDSVIYEIWRQIWLLYDDISTHRLRDEHALDEKLRRAVCRMILFFQTDLEYEWPSQRVIERVFNDRVVRFSSEIIIVVALSVFSALLIALVSKSDLLYGILPFVSAISLFFSVRHVIRHADVPQEYQESDNPIACTDRTWPDAFGNDEGIWPFYRRSDYEEALKHPKLLCGKN